MSDVVDLSVCVSLFVRKHLEEEEKEEEEEMHVVLERVSLILQVISVLNVGIWSFQWNSFRLCVSLSLKNRRMFVDSPLQMLHSCTECVSLRCVLQFVDTLTGPLCKQL